MLVRKVVLPPLLLLVHAPQVAEAVLEQTEGALVIIQLKERKALVKGLPLDAEVVFLIILQIELHLRELDAAVHVGQGALRQAPP